MAVTFEPTPNPQSMKFMLGQDVTETPVEFKSAQEAFSCPLAAKIFGFPWAESVFVGRNFMTITKQEWVEWSTLADPLAGLIQEHLESGQPVFAEAMEDDDVDENDSPAVKTIKQILNQEIRPAVAMDGGDILFHKYEENVVYLFLKGACSGCPSSTMTLKMGVEARLKEALPEISEVVALQ